MATLVKPAEHAWVESGSADNATAVAAKPGEAGKVHYVSMVRASYSNPSTSGTLTLKIGGMPVAETTIHGDGAIYWVPALQITEGADVSVELAPSGTAGVIGSVILSGYTF